MQTTYTAWVTSPATETPRRVEVTAADRTDALRRVLRAAPPGSRASCRPSGALAAQVLADLAERRSPFPLVVAA